MGISWPFSWVYLAEISFFHCYRSESSIIASHLILTRIQHILVITSFIFSQTSNTHFVPHYSKALSHLSNLRVFRCDSQNLHSGKSPKIFSLLSIPCYHTNTNTNTQLLLFEHFIQQRKSNEARSPNWINPLYTKLLKNHNGLIRFICSPLSFVL